MSCSALRCAVEIPRSVEIGLREEANDVATEGDVAGVRELAAAGVRPELVEVSPGHWVEDCDYVRTDR